MKRARTGRSRGFHWVGRGRDRVNRWSRTEKGLLWLGRIFTTYALIACAVGIASLCFAFLHGFHTLAMRVIMPIGLTHFATFGGIGFLALHIHRYFGRLLSAEQVCSRLGVEPDSLDQLAAERRIKPRVIINERPLYDLADFSESMSLLRGSAMPVPQETLLRAVSGSADCRKDELLRANSDFSDSTEATCSSLGVTRDTEPAEEEAQLHGGVGRL